VAILLNRGGLCWEGKEGRGVGLALEGKGRQLRSRVAVYPLQ